LWPPWWSTGKMVIFSSKWAPGGHLEFPYILSPIPTPMLHFKRICQHLRLVERER
jgi:hypothetical protein